jgi:hypothetical protein
MKLSENIYNFESDLRLSELNEKLSSRTLAKDFLIMEKTNKDFIGQVQGNKFSIISSWFPLGSACVIKGEIKQEDTPQISLLTTLHIAFRILYALWAIVMFGMIIFSSIENFHLGSIVALIIGLILFRMFMHGVYVISRNQAVKKIEKMLNLKRNTRGIT